MMVCNLSKLVYISAVFPLLSWHNVVGGTGLIRDKVATCTHICNKYI